MQQQVSMFDWVCKYDMQIFLTNNIAYHRAFDSGEYYADYMNMLRLSGCEGLEQLLWYKLFDHFMNSYVWKGYSSSYAWNRIIFTIAEKFVQQGDGNVSFCKVFSKYMNEKAKSRSVTNDESCFILDSGQLVYNTMSIKKCYVSNMNLESLKISGSTDKHFNYVSILKGYTQRSN